MKNSTLSWVPSNSTITLAGHALSNVHVLNGQSSDDGTQVGFAVDLSLPVEHSALPISTDVQVPANYWAWTPVQRGCFLYWSSSGRPSLPDTPLAEAFYRLAFANVEARLLAGDTDHQLLGATTGLQHAPQSILLRSGIAKKLNQAVQFAAHCRGVDQHMAAITTLRSLPGLTWSKPEMNLLMTGFQQSGTPLDANNASFVAWATLTADEYSAATAKWQEMWTRFQEEFKKLFPAGLLLTRPPATIAFAYEPAHSDLTRVLPAGTRLSMDLPDFYSDGQLTPVLNLFRSVFGLLTDAEKARRFLNRVTVTGPVKALETLSKLCGWDTIRTRRAVGTALNLGYRQPEALKALHPPCDAPDWLKAQMFMQAQDGITIREQLPTALMVVCDWGSLERAEKAIKEASAESGLDLTADYPLCR